VQLKSAIIAPGTPIEALYPEILAAGGDVVSIVPETAKYAREL
jgi:hypothetical protein